MNTKMISDSLDAGTTAIAENLRLLHTTLSNAARLSRRAASLIQSGERNGAIGTVAGLDVVLDDAKALYCAALLHHVRMNRMKRKG